MSRPYQCLARVIGVVLGLCPAHRRAKGLPPRPKAKHPPRQGADSNGHPHRADVPRAQGAL
jgi:hypothetical protein